MQAERLSFHRTQHGGPSRKTRIWRYIALALPAAAVAFSTREVSAADRRASSADSPSWVVIQPGIFSMGAQPGPDALSTGAQRTYAGPDWDEAPVHEVRISQPYALAPTKVTQAEFARFRPSHREFIQGRGMEWKPAAPAVLVTWHDAVAYCRWRSEQEGEPIRLPTEAEWEFAARHASRLGLRGMGDGILEWCHDWWAPYAPAAATDPRGPQQGEVRVARGRSGERTETSNVEVDGKTRKVRRVVKPSASDRSGTVPDDRRINIGFRVVRAPLAEGTLPAALPVAAVFRDVAQARAVWRPPESPGTPTFFGGVTFFPVPADPLAVPYFGRQHVPSIVACDNGDLLVTAMSAPADSSDQMVVLISRLRQGREQWDAPARFFIAPDRDVDSAVLFNAGNGELHHYNSVGGGDHRFSIIKRISTDNGASWSLARLVYESPAAPATRQLYTGEPRFWSHLAMVRLADGTFVLPSDAGYADFNGEGSVLWSSRDRGDSWQQLTRFGWNHREFAQAGGQAGWIAGIHAPLMVLADGRLLAFGRGNNIGDRMPMSLSGDGGKTWTYHASRFPPILNSQRPALLRLREGPLVFFSYTDASPRFQDNTYQGMDFPDATGAIQKGVGTFAAVSLDEGKSWTYRKLIPADAGNPWTSDRGGYLACIQTPDDMIHLVSSRKYYRFNLAWLKTPSPAGKPVTQGESRPRDRREATAATAGPPRVGQTPDGMEIRPAWRAPRPQAGAVALGFPLLANARHVTIFEPRREEGAYNHHSELIWHRGKFYAMWSNHPFTEDGPGQRVLWTTAETPERWSAARELFPAPGPVEPETPKDRPRPAFASALTWMASGERLFAVAAVNTAGPIAREVFATGELGPIFRLWRREAALPFPALAADEGRVAARATELVGLLGTPDYWPWWDFWDEFPEPATVNGRKLVEPTVHRAREGAAVMLLRDSEAVGGYSHRVFMSIARDGGKTWPPAQPTDIPDSPSRRDMVRLDDGTIVMVGNQVAPDFDNGDKVKHYARDPLTVAVSRDGYVFERAYALRWNLPKKMRVDGVKGRGVGAQYPSAIAHEGSLYVLHSVGKEDIAISWVPLGDLGL